MSGKLKLPGTLRNQTLKIFQTKYAFNVSALSKGGFSMHTNPVIMIARC